MTQTIQKTGKVWKFQILLASLVAIVGVVGAIVQYNLDPTGEPSGAQGLWCAAAFLGTCWFLFARICAWWFHG